MTIFAFILGCMATLAALGWSARVIYRQHRETEQHYREMNRKAWKQFYETRKP